MSDNSDLLRRLFEAVEERDIETILDCYDEEIDIVEADSLPYGGVHHGHDGALKHAAAWMESWGSLQTADDRRYRGVTFLEGEGDMAAAVFRHQATDHDRDAHLDNPEVGIYRFRNGKIVHSQMFHADSAALVRFLESAHEA